MATKHLWQGFPVMDIGGSECQMLRGLEPHLYEMRFFFGAGYRIYYTLQEGRVVLLLAGGDKSTQDQDIAKARAILDSLE